MWQRVAEAAVALIRGAVNLLYPPACMVCLRPLPEEPVLLSHASDSSAQFRPSFCDTCKEELTSDSYSTCPACAATVGPHAATAGGCLQCRNEHLAFARAVRLGPYEGLLRDVVLRMKHRDGEGLAEEVGEFWGWHTRPALTALGAELIVPVPLHWWRRWRRGYNQSEALALGLSRVLQLPCAVSALRRNRHTPPQTHQSYAARRQNVRGAFLAPKPALVRGRSVLLVDDVLTTGATTSEAARALRKAGAAQVCVAALTRAGND